MIISNIGIDHESIILFDLQKLMSEDDSLSQFTADVYRLSCAYGDIGKHHVALVPSCRALAQCPATFQIGIVTDPIGMSVIKMFDEGSRSDWLEIITRFLTTLFLV